MKLTVGPIHVAPSITVFRKGDGTILLVCGAASLRGWNFSDQDFDGADFRNEDLSGARFSGTLLVHADFRGADLSYATFNGASIRGADFRGATILRTSFAYAPRHLAKFDKELTA